MYRNTHIHTLQVYYCFPLFDHLSSLMRRSKQPDAEQEDVSFESISLFNFFCKGTNNSKIALPEMNQV